MPQTLIKISNILYENIFPKWKIVISLILNIKRISIYFQHKKEHFKNKTKQAIISNICFKKNILDDRFENIQ